MLKFELIICGLALVSAEYILCCLFELLIELKIMNSASSLLILSDEFD